MITSLFYVSAFLLLYAYLLYPVVLIALSASQPRRADADDESAGGSTAAPSLSVIVAAYNEERCIAHKIENFLSCRYSGEAEMKWSLTDRATAPRR